MSQYTLQLDEFDFKFASCATICVLGKRRTGKSTAGNFIATRLANSGIRKFAVFCGNRDNMCEWQRIIHPLYVHGADIEKIVEIIEYQEKRIGEDRTQFEKLEKDKKRRDPDYVEEEYEVPIHLQVCIFFDDVGMIKKFTKHERVNFIATNGRHLGIILIQLNQYLVQLPSECRDQQDYIFILNCSNTRGVDRLWDEYVTDACVEKKNFSYILSACTGKRGKCLVINNTSDYTITERLKYAKIPWPPCREYIGSKQFIRYGKKHYISEQNRKMQEKQKLETPKVPIDSRRFDENSCLPTELTGGSSVVSIDRNHKYDLRNLNEGHETFRDKKGNVVQIQLKNR